MHVSKKLYEKLILTALSGSFLVTIFRTIRWPNDWAEAKWFVIYEFGLVVLITKYFTGILRLNK